MAESRKPGWQSHIVPQLNGRERPIELSGQFQVVNDHWADITPAMPNVGFMPNLVYKILTGGFTALSQIPGLESLLDEFTDDPEVQRFGKSM